MLPTLRMRSARCDGFTLIEVLVVILIIGVLAAIAIPSFINQTGKASDAGAKSIARIAQTAEETAFTEGQAYVAQAVGAGSAGLLSSLETTLVAPSAACSGSPPYPVSPCGLVATASSSGFSVSVTSRTGVVFTLARNATGAVTRTCDVSRALGARGGCVAPVAGVGTW